MPVEPPEPQWKNTKLSFERPYKDDLGNCLPVLYDLTPECERIYERYASLILKRFLPITLTLFRNETASEKLGASLQRIIFERGADFLERREVPRPDNLVLSAVGDIAGGVQLVPAIEAPPGPNPKIMTVEELHAMRSEILPRLSYVFRIPLESRK